MQIFWINHMHHKGRFSISQFSSYEQNKRTSAHAYVLCQDAWKPVLRKPDDSQSCARKRGCELENVKPSTASSTGVGRKAKRGTAVFLYSISEARHLGDGVIRSTKSLFVRLPTPALLAVCGFFKVTLAVTLAHWLVLRPSSGTFKQNGDWWQSGEVP